MKALKRKNVVQGVHLWPVKVTLNMKIEIKAISLVMMRALKNSHSVPDQVNASSSIQEHLVMPESLKMKIKNY